MLSLKALKKLFNKHSSPFIFNNNLFSRNIPTQNHLNINNENKELIHKIKFQFSKSFKMEDTFIAKMKNIGMNL